VIAVVFIPVGMLQAAITLCEKIIPLMTMAKAIHFLVIVFMFV
jgi:hypothetical protein